MAGLACRRVDPAAGSLGLRPQPGLFRLGFAWPGHGSNRRLLFDGAFFRRFDFGVVDGGLDQRGVLGVRLVDGLGRVAAFVGTP